MPPLEERADQVQREVWKLSEKLAELQPFKAPIQEEEDRRRQQLSVIARYNKDRLVRQAEQKEARKLEVLARLEEERLEAERQQREREKFLQTDQVKAERRARAHLQVVQPTMFLKLPAIDNINTNLIN